jgi:dihydrofolate synthase/folylpolyglutamate synthase
LLPRFEKVIFTRYTNNPRCVPPSELVRLAEELSLSADVSTTADPSAAWELAQSIVGPEDLVCITGSFFLAGEMRGLIAQLAGRSAKCEAQEAHDEEASRS